MSKSKVLGKNLCRLQG